MAKVGFRTAGFHEWAIERALAELARIGYDGVEICLEHPDCRPSDLTPQRSAELAHACRDLGLEVASVSYHGDVEPQPERRRNARLALDLVRPFGTDILILNGRRVELNDEAEGLAELEALLDELLPRAAELGVRLALEPEPGLATGSSDQMLQLIRRRDSDFLGVNLDVGHAYLTDPDVCASIPALGPSIFHTHVEGMPAGEHRHLLPGEGDLDLAAVCAALADTGYAGYYTVDLFRIADDPVDWARRALAGVRRVLAGSR